ncbi:MAG: type IV pilus modification protein PilV [Pseudomonadales bacterium]|nr:type IV pilus modification protein PilV [Pseudomonadales bacterium]
MMINGFHSLPGQTGTTLIEVLVSLLILSVGLLGMAGLQTVSLRNTQAAYQRTQATLSAQDMMERMRANPQGVNSGAYNNAGSAISAACMSATGCSAGALALHDVAEWQAALLAALPAGTGVVCLDSTPQDGTPAAPACDGSGTLYAIKIWWDANRDGTANQLLAMSAFL